MARKKSLSVGSFAVAPKPTPKRVADDAETEFVGVGNTHRSSEKKQKAPQDATVSPNPRGRRKQKTPPDATISPSSRGGTIAVPYVRTDGVLTRATTIHLPVKVHEQLRRHCFETNVSMSQLVSDLISARLSG